MRIRYGYVTKTRVAVFAGCASLVYNWFHPWWGQATSEYWGDPSSFGVTEYKKVILIYIII